ncbi:MAG: hypothetical protein QN172_01860 [Armatimonadota bacterium]|nr:hypothetical protein [Armatimonadota bacterium]MDR7440341.1 hypothetical protein [Armatimonadota bacterium]MDR7562472.1 hypothetical protein [Armatimonadota bacterium]MDR7566828.1 hypothetical protein [Armatimonadota bacterium]MDR7601185.1 hypothetical protein [Armatimonadota bacterium]
MERSSKRRAGLRVTALMAALLLVTPGWAAPEEPPARLRLPASPARRLPLVVQPGYTLFLLFPRPVEYIAVGNQRVVRAWVRAREGTVALYAMGRAGATNLHVRVGGQLWVFWVRVGRRRTADVVEIAPPRPPAPRASPQKAIGAPGSPRPRAQRSPAPPPSPRPTPPQLPAPVPAPQPQPPISASPAPVPTVPAPVVQPSPQPERREEPLAPGQGLGLPVRLRLRYTGTNWSEAWVPAAVSILLIGLPVLPATLIYEHEATVELLGMRATGRLAMRQRYVMMTKQGEPEGAFEAQTPAGRILLRVWGEGERLRVEVDPTAGSGAFEGVYGRGEVYRTGQEGGVGVYEGVVAFGWQSRSLAVSKLRAALEGSDPGLAEAAARAIEQAAALPLGRPPSDPAGRPGRGEERVHWRPGNRAGTGEVELEMARAVRVRVVVAEGEGFRVLYEAEHRGATSVRVPVSCSGPCVVLVYVDGRVIAQIRPWRGGETGGQ